MPADRAGAPTAASGAGAAGGDAAPDPGRAFGDVLGPPASDAGATTEETLRRLRPVFRKCYQRGLQDHPRLGGQITLTAHVGPTGEVESVEGPDGGPLAPIVPCLKGAAASATFPPPATGRAAVAIPLTFVAQQ